MSRPILIDPTDGPCEICAAWEAKRAEAGRSVCARCDGEILPFQNMGGNGFQSVHPDHFHLETVGEVAGRRCKYAELCHECYWADHEATYPDQPRPLLPKVFTDINVRGSGRLRDDPKLFRPADGDVLEEYRE